MSSSARRPICSPSFDLATVVILSTIKLHRSRSPLRSSGTTGSRNNGAGVGSVVTARTVTDSVASKRSSWTMTTVGAYRRTRSRPPPSRSRRVSLLVHADGVDEGLIVGGVAARGDGHRLLVGLFRELR